MYEAFIKYCNRHQLLPSSGKVLLAVSGGADSVVLFHLFRQTGLEFAVAHCNFKLRGVDAENDEQFVRNLAASHNILCHVISFETKAYAEKHKISIEMAARELRYRWFDQLVQEQGYALLATGHHVNDSLETFLLNLARGTGIQGLTGIAPKTGNIIRPLLFASREQIVGYALDNSFNYCTDHTNADNKFKRNLIRNEMIPIFRSLNPDFERTMYNNMEILQHTAALYSREIARMKKELLISNQEQTEIDLSELDKDPAAKTILFELIRDFGFNSSQCADIIENSLNDTGKMFFSESHLLLLNRQKAIIKTKEEENPDKEYLIESANDFKNLPFEIKSTICKHDGFTLIKEAHTACIDLHTIEFPLTLRKWQQGDVFYPMGMKGRKKLSNFFVDQKIDRLTKNNIWILTSNNSIVWIVGHRIDRRFAVQDSTKEILLLQVIN